MDLRALRYFVEVVRQHSFSAAARTLFVTQPTVSKMIQVLEDEVGVPLLVRDAGQRKRQVVMTDAGQLVYAKAQTMLAAEADLRVELESAAELRQGTLRLGIPSLGAQLIGPAIAQYHQRWPGVEVRLTEAGSRVIETALRSAELDVGTLLTPVSEDIEYLPAWDHRMWLLAPKGSRWAGKKCVPLAALSGEPFLLYAESFMLNSVILRACEGLGFTPTIACRSSQWDLLATLVECGMGIAVLPAPYCRQFSRNRFVSVPIVEPELHWNLVFGWRRGAYLSHAARAWLDTAKTYFQTATGAG